MDLPSRLRAIAPAWLDRIWSGGAISHPAANGGNGRKSIVGAETGVSFVGLDTSRIVWLEGGANPDADRLTRAIALATSAYCFTAIEYRWKTVSEPPLILVRDTDDGEETVLGHPLEMILDEPSPDFDMGELQAITEAYRLLTGAALWVRNRASDDGPTVGFTPFSGDQFTTESANGRIFGRFFVNTASGRKEYAPADVVHFREINPNSWRTPLSKVDVALSMLDLGHQINRTIRNFMRKAMFPGGVVSPHQDWDPDEDEFQQYVNRVKAWHAGPANAGEPLVLLGGSQFSGTTLKLRDLLPDELMDRIEATIAAVFGIPPVVLGWLVGLRNSPWSQMSEARRMTYEDTIEPRWHEIAKTMTRQILDPYDRAAGLRIAFDTVGIRALQADTAKRAGVVNLLQNDWTRDERRIYTGQEPIGGDLGDEIGVSSGGGLPDLAGGKTEFPGAAGSKLASDPRGLAWTLFDANCKAAERTWESIVFSLLETQAKAIAALAREHLESKDIDPNSARRFTDKTEEYLQNAIPDFITLVYPLVFTTAEKAVRQAAAKVKVGFTVLEEALAGYADRETAFLVDKMGETTGKAVAAAVQKGLDAGETIQGLVARLKELPEFDRKRAKLVARTETTRAWNGSQRETLSGYQFRTGVQIEKSWLSARDGVAPLGRVRPEHDELDDRKWYPIDHVFANGLTEPGEPNCRCTLDYRVAPESEAVAVPANV